jgi:hypothetical protein
VSDRPLEDLLSEPREDLIVEDETTVTLDGETEVANRARRIVKATTLEDLQVLDLVPKWLSERPLREAIARDDEEALGLAREQMTRSPAPCGCGEGAAEEGVAGGADVVELRPAKLTHRDEYRRTYTGMRKSFHPNLAALMTESSGTRFTPTDLLVIMVHGWFTHLITVEIVQFPIWLFEEVKVGRGSTILVGRGERGLYCGDLRIRRGGRILAQGSGLKIRCLTAQGDLP